LDDEIKGEEEFNAELRRKKANIDDSIFDFDKPKAPQFGGFQGKKAKE
jgi:hypothetical protein